jgi:hypothetical protein
MKALSILQPWAWLIVHGPKDIENRTWSTPFRGEFLVHAGKGFDRDGYDFVRKARPDIPMPAPHEFDRGGVVGIATVVDCVTESTSWWFNGPRGFVLTDRRPLPFTPYRGQLSWFEIPYEVPTNAQ